MEKETATSEEWLLSHWYFWVGILQKKKGKKKIWVGLGIGIFEVEKTCQAVSAPHVEYPEIIVKYIWR